MHKRLRLELPGKVLPPLPRKNKNNSLFSNGNDDDNDSISSESVQSQHLTVDDPPNSGGLRSYFGYGFSKRNSSTASLRSSHSPRPSGDQARPVMLYREEQRVSLRASLRSLLQNEQIASSAAIKEFLTKDPVELNEEEMMDCEKRTEADEKRMAEQRQFYEIARQRAQELDVHMEKFRRDIVESSKSQLAV